MRALHTAMVWLCPARIRKWKLSFPSFLIISYHLSTQRTQPAASNTRGQGLLLLLLLVSGADGDLPSGHRSQQRVLETIVASDSLPGWWLLGLRLRNVKDYIIVTIVMILFILLLLVLLLVVVIAAPSSGTWFSQSIHCSAAGTPRQRRWTQRLRLCCSNMFKRFHNSCSIKSETESHPWTRTAPTSW